MAQELGALTPGGFQPPGAVQPYGAVVAPPGAVQPPPIQGGGALSPRGSFTPVATEVTGTPPTPSIFDRTADGKWKRVRDPYISPQAKAQANQRARDEVIKELGPVPQTPMAPGQGLYLTHDENGNRRYGIFIMATGQFVDYAD